MWGFLTHLPAVLAFVLAIGTGVLLLIGFETALIIYEEIKALLGQRYQRAVIALEKLRTQGVILRNRLVTSDAEVKLFAADLEAFEATVLVAMRGAASPTAIAWFRDLPVWKVGHGVSAFNEEHALLKAILGEKLRRMHQIACQLGTKIAA